MKTIAEELHRDGSTRIDADGLHYSELNERIRAALADGPGHVTVDNVRGQRYIGAGLARGARITVNGVAGNDLAAFMNGAEITVNGNAQDGVGNTMNGGKVLIHGDAGDVVAHSLRGGKVFVRGDVGYRAGIHMKAYNDHFPVVVVGGTAKDYLGEYLAGGVLVVLGLGLRSCPGPAPSPGLGARPRLATRSPAASPAGGYLATGIHGGLIFLRGEVEPHQAGYEARIGRPDERDWALLKGVLDEYCADFGLDGLCFEPDEFVRLGPHSSRPYGELYAY